MCLATTTITISVTVMISVIAVPKAVPPGDFMAAAVFTAEASTVGVVSMAVGVVGAAMDDKAAHLLFLIL
jgi:hypothetical protein